MNNENSSKLEKWRAKYASLAVAIGCLYSVIVNWGENWFMTALLSAGGGICGTVAIYDLKRVFNRYKHRRR